MTAAVRAQSPWNSNAAAAPGDFGDQVALRVDRPQALRIARRLDVERFGLGQDDLSPGPVHAPGNQSRDADFDALADLEMVDLLLPNELDLAVADQFGLAGEAPSGGTLGQVGRRRVDRLVADRRRDVADADGLGGHVDAERLHAAVEDRVIERRLDTSPPLARPSPQATDES